MSSKKVEYSENRLFKKSLIILLLLALSLGLFAKEANAAAASIGPNNQNVNYGQNIQFDYSISGMKPLDYTIDLDSKNIISNTINSASYSNNIQISPSQYASLGPHTIKISVTDNFGNTQSSQATFTVNAVCNPNSYCETGETATSCPADCIYCTAGTGQCRDNNGNEEYRDCDTSRNVFSNFWQSCPFQTEICWANTGNVNYSYCGLNPVIAINPITPSSPQAGQAFNISADTRGPLEFWYVEEVDASGNKLRTVLQKNDISTCDGYSLPRSLNTCTVSTIDTKPAVGTYYYKVYGQPYNSPNVTSSIRSVNVVCADGTSCDLTMGGKGYCASPDCRTTTLTISMPSQVVRNTLLNITTSVTPTGQNVRASGLVSGTALSSPSLVNTQRFNITNPSGTYQITFRAYAKNDPVTIIKEDIRSVNVIDCITDSDCPADPICKKYICDNNVCVQHDLPDTTKNGTNIYCFGGQPQTVTITSTNATAIALTTHTFSNILSSTQPGLFTKLTTGSSTIDITSNAYNYATTISDITSNPLFTFRILYGSTEFLTKTVKLTVTCKPGDGCYCPSSSNQGCIRGRTNEIIISGYCSDTSAVCVQCPANKVYNNITASCTDCFGSNVNYCNPNECQTASCDIYGSCMNNNKPQGTPCNGGSSVCDAYGACGACDNSWCSGFNITTTVANDSSTPIECFDQIRTVHTTPIKACVNNNCQQTGNNVFYTYTNVSKIENSTCTKGGKSGLCLMQPNYQLDCITNNTCLNDNDCSKNDICSTCNIKTHLCEWPSSFNSTKQTEICSKVDWEANLSICNSIVNMCNSAVFCQSGTSVIDHDCRINSTLGLCKNVIYSQYACLPLCEAVGNHFCTNNPPANSMQDTTKSCKANSCYQCKPGYIYSQSTGCYPASLVLDAKIPEGSINKEMMFQVTITDGSGRDVTGEYQLKMVVLENGQPKNFEGVGSLTIMLNSPGRHPATITAVKDGEAKGILTTTILVRCQGACCDDTSWKPEGATCTKDNIPGYCKDNDCKTACTPKTSQETGKDNQGRDRCNNGIDDDCDGLMDCSDESCRDFCHGTLCSANMIYCTDKCIMPKTDMKNCGYCDQECVKNQQQCIEGECVDIADCNVACIIDKDCPKGHVCINPGDCKKSWCAPTSIMQANSSQIEEMSKNILSTKSYKIVKELYGNKLHITIYNLAPQPLKNVTITVNINLPKDIVASASDLASDTPFTVIIDDPVIQFDFDEIASRKDIVIDLPKTPDPKMISNINVGLKYEKAAETIDPLTAEKITITNNLVKENGRTKLLIGLDPHAKLAGVRIPIEIPKCVAASAKDLNLSGDYEVIKDDPLVVWTFDSLNSKENIEIDLGEKDVEDDCRNGITAFAVASDIDKPINPWIPLMVIPIVGFIIIFFQKFKAGDVEKKVDKEEFIRLAKQEGQSDEQAEESWKEYKKKF